MPILPTHVANGAANSSTGAFTVAVPAGIQEYDVLFCFVETDDQAVATPTDWTSMFSGALAGGTRLQIFWRRVGIDAIPNPTISDGGDHQLAIIAAFRGCRTTGNPYDVIGSVASNSIATVTASTITTTIANTLVCMAISTTAGHTAAGYTNANLANIAELFDVNTTQGNDGALMLAKGEKATAGSVGATTATLTGSGPGWAAVQFALANADEIILPHIGPTSVAYPPTVQNQDIILPHIGPTSVVYPLKVGTHIRLSTDPIEVVLEPEPDFRLSTMPIEVVAYPNPHARLSSMPIEVVVVPDNPAVVVTQAAIEVARRQSNESVRIVWWD